VVERFLETPYDLKGKDASELLSKRRTRRQRALSPDTDTDTGEDKPPKKRREKKRKENEQYKSATFIEDSDAEYGDIDAFLEKEKVLRERMAVASATNGKIATMKATGTKKRRRKGTSTASKKRKGHEETAQADSDQDLGDHNSSKESDGASESVDRIASMGEGHDHDHDQRSRKHRIPVQHQIERLQDLANRSVMKSESRIQTRHHHPCPENQMEVPHR